MMEFGLEKSFCIIICILLLFKTLLIDIDHICYVLVLNTQ